MPEIPDELYAVRFAAHGRSGWMGNNELYISCTPNREAAESNVGPTDDQEAVLIGVSPARLAKAEAEIERLRCELEDLAAIKAMDASCGRVAASLALSLSRHRYRVEASTKGGQS